MFARASIENLEQIIEIELQSFDKPWTENHFRSDIKNSSSYNRVYLKNKRVVAYLFGFCVIDEFTDISLAAKSICPCIIASFNKFFKYSF